MRIKRILQIIILICIALLYNCKQIEKPAVNNPEPLIIDNKNGNTTSIERDQQNKIDSENKKNKPLKTDEIAKIEPKKTIEKKLETPILISDGSYYEPKFCNNDQLIYTNLDGTKIFLKNLLTNKTKVLLEGKNFRNNFSWDKKSCSAIYYKSKSANYKVLIKKLNINTNKTTTLSNFPDLVSLDAISANDTIYYLDKQSLQIKGQYVNKDWNVTETNKSYYGLLLSPNGKLLAAHSGANVYIINTQSKKTQLLGKGIVTSWNADNKHLIGFLDHSNDGHSISNSDILVFNAKTFQSKKLTQTKNIYEAYPHFNSDNKIGYVDLKNGGVYIKSFNYILP